MRNVVFFLAIAVGIVVQLAQTLALAGRPRIEPPLPAIAAPAPAGAPGSEAVPRPTRANSPGPASDGVQRR